METVALIIMMIVSLSFVLKLTYHRFVGVAVLSAVVALSVAMNWDVAIEQSKTQIADWLADTELMLDIAVLLTVDVVIAMAFCMLQAQLSFGDKLSLTLRITYLILKWVPGLLIFPTMFSLLVYAIFALTGVDFATIAWALAALIFVLSIAAAYGIKYLLPETEVRIELTFLINALIAILGVIATVNGCTAVKGTSEVDWVALAGVVALLIAGGIAGYILYLHKTKKRIKTI